VRVVELASHRLCSPIAPMLHPIVVIWRISDTGKTPRIHEGQTAPLAARIGERDQVPGQVAAIHGGDVLGIERP
jgi:hypothetical protein